MPRSRFFRYVKTRFLAALMLGMVGPVWAQTEMIVSGPVYASNSQTSLFSQEMAQQSLLQTLARQTTENAPGKDTGFWMENDDSFGSTANTSTPQTFNQSDTLFMAGDSFQMGDGLIGGLNAGYLQSQSNSADGLSGIAMKGWEVGLIAVKRGTMDFTAEASFGFDNYMSSRSVVIGSDVSQAQGIFNGIQFGLSAQVGLPWESEGLKLEPLVGLRWCRLGMNAFTETGADPLNLAVSAQSYDAISPYLGMSGSRNFDLGKNSLLTPFFNLTLSRDLLDETPSYQAALSGAPSNSFTVTGNTPDPLLWGAGGGVQFSLNDAKFYAAYNGFFNSSQNLNALQVGLSLAL